MDEDQFQREMCNNTTASRDANWISATGFSGCPEKCQLRVMRAHKFPHTFDKIWLPFYIEADNWVGKE
jgi:hypothetical protein